MKQSIGNSNEAKFDVRKGSKMSEFEKEMLLIGVLIIMNLYIILKDEFKKNN